MEDSTDPTDCQGTDPDDQFHLQLRIMKMPEAAAIAFLWVGHKSKSTNSLPVFAAAWHRLWHKL
jgi:hypothetical protein